MRDVRQRRLNGTRLRSARARRALGPALSLASR
jgi:hypothetical protein